MSACTCRPPAACRTACCDGTAELAWTALRATLRLDAVAEVACAVCRVPCICPSLPRTFPSLRVWLCSRVTMQPCGCGCVSECPLPLLNGLWLCVCVPFTTLDMAACLSACCSSWYGCVAVWPSALYPSCPAYPSWYGCVAVWQDGRRRL